jgi:hypothetical protein
MKLLMDSLIVAWIKTKEVLFSPFNLNNWLTFGIISSFITGSLAGLPSLASLISLFAINDTVITIVIASILIYIKAHATFIFMESILKNKIDIMEYWKSLNEKSGSYLLWLILISWLTFLLAMIPFLGCFAIFLIMIISFVAENAAVPAMMKMSSSINILGAVKIILNRFKTEWKKGLLFLFSLFVMDFIWNVIILIPSFLLAYFITNKFGISTDIKLISAEIFFFFYMIIPVYSIFRTNYCLSSISIILPEYKILMPVKNDNGKIIKTKTMYDGWLD